MKKFLALTFSFIALLSLSVYGDDNVKKGAVSPSAKAELHLFAASSLTGTLDDIIILYKKVSPNVSIVPTYDSSGTLKTQIQEGSECDLFISAAQKQMNQLDGACMGDPQKNPDKLDLINARTRVNILENRVVLVVPKGNPAGIRSFKEMPKAKLIALGNSDVPVGSYSLEILKSLGLDIKALEKAGKVSYGSNVKEVMTHVAEGTVDCGIVYLTDASAAGLTVVDTAEKSLCKPVVYPAAVLKKSRNAASAQAFLDYLRSAEAAAVFVKAGFSKAK